MHIGNWRAKISYEFGNLGGALFVGFAKQTRGSPRAKVIVFITHPVQRGWFARGVDRPMKICPCYERISED